MINRQCRAIIRTTVSGFAPDPFAFPEKIGPLRQTEDFIPVILSDGAVETSRIRRVGTLSRPFPAPPLIFPDTLMYYRFMNADALIPVAFPVAGPVANMPTACMNR